MRKHIAALLCAVLVVSGGVPVLDVPRARADFEAPPPPPSPPPPSPPADPPKQQPQNDSRSRVKGGKIAGKVLVCGGGKLIIHLGRPVPLKKMSKRQWKRYQVILAQYERARLIWGVGCPAIPHIAWGVVIPVAIIAADDFRLRFITGELPIKRTKRQEQQMFCRDGSSPCPDLTGQDPDLYGPA